MSTLRYYLSQIFCVEALCLYVLLALVGSIIWQVENRKQRWPEGEPRALDVMALLVTAHRGERLLEVRGVEMRREGKELHYVRPVDAAGVEVILVTADNRRWKAHWQEVSQ